MASTLVNLHEDGTEDRMFRLLIDSRNVLDHDNTNPSSYTIALPETLTGVKRIRLTRQKLIMSSQFVFIRASGWFASGATADSTSRHCLEIISRTNQPEKEGSPINIFNSDGTVQMQVVESFSKTITADDNGDFRIYTVYLCTGRMESQFFSTDIFYISDPTDSSTFDIPLQISQIGSDDGSVYSSTRNGSNAVTITTLRSEAYLKLWANNIPLTRVSQPAKAFPTWASYEVYRPGDVISYRPHLSDVETSVLIYECNKSHFSLIWSEDVSLYWQVLTGADIASKTDGAFYMVLPNDTNEHINIKEFRKDQVVYETPDSTNMREVSVKWQTRKGSAFIFPSFGTLNVFSLETTPYAYARKVFHHHQLELEIEYSIYPR
jgi:hypothetical protein